MVAKQFVIDRFTENNNEAVIETEKDTGKYGRYIGTIKLADNSTSLNDELIEKGCLFKSKFGHNS